MPKLSFLVLAWNSEKYLERCLGSIVRAVQAEDISFEIVVVDNGSTDGSARLYEDFSKTLGSQFILVKLQKNYGTTVSRNLGIGKATGDFLCILDSDTELTAGGWGRALAQLQENPGLGILAPRLIFPDGSTQPSVKRLPALWHKLLKIGKILFGLKLPNLDFYEGFPFSCAMYVDSAISACWLMRMEVVRKLGGLDEKIFYSPEDLEYCVRLRKAGLSLVYWPELNVIHHTQQITHRRPLSRISISHFMGLLYFYGKHGGWFGRKSVLAPFDQSPMVPLPEQNGRG